MHHCISSCLRGALGGAVRLSVRLTINLLVQHRSHRQPRIRSHFTVCSSLGSFRPSVHPTISLSVHHNHRRRRRCHQPSYLISLFSRHLMAQCICAPNHQSTGASQPPPPSSPPPPQPWSRIVSLHCLLVHFQAQFAYLYIFSSTTTVIVAPIIAITAAAATVPHHLPSLSAVHFTAPSASRPPSAARSPSCHQRAPCVSFPVSSSSSVPTLHAPLPSSSLASNTPQHSFLAPRLVSSLAPSFLTLPHDQDNSHTGTSGII